jgi:hypothetical protein
VTRMQVIYSQRISMDHCLKNMQLHYLLDDPTSLLMLMAAKLSVREGVEGRSADHTSVEIWRALALLV